MIEGGVSFGIDTSEDEPDRDAVYRAIIDALDDYFGTRVGWLLFDQPFISHPPLNKEGV